MAKRWSLFVIVLSGFVLSGCLQTEAPKCSDSDVTGLVEQIYAEHIEELKKDNPMAAMYVEMVPKKIVKIDSARAMRYDKEVKLRECKAVAYFENNQSSDIEYTVQLDEQDESQFYVELDLDFLEDLLKSGLWKNILK